jgi:hypothetical protein
MDFLLRLFSQTLLLLRYKKKICPILMLLLTFIFEKRAANLVRMHKIAYFYVKTGLWVLTINFLYANNFYKQSYQPESLMVN